MFNPPSPAYQRISAAQTGNMGGTHPAMVVAIVGRHQCTIHIQPCIFVLLQVSKSMAVMFASPGFEWQYEFIVSPKESLLENSSSDNVY